MKIYETNDFGILLSNISKQAEKYAFEAKNANEEAHYVGIMYVAAQLAIAYNTEKGGINIDYDRAKELFKEYKECRKSEKEKVFKENQITIDDILSEIRDSLKQILDDKSKSKKTKKD